MRRVPQLPGIFVFIFLLVLSQNGCRSAAQRGAFGGGALGAIAGQMIGGDTESTLLGAGIGALGGALANDYMAQSKKQSYMQGYKAGSSESKPLGYTSSPSSAKRPDVIVEESNYYYFYNE